MKHDQRRSITYSQNFLKNPRLARQTVETSSLDRDDLVIEIGPGKGLLTRELARHCHQVLAIEKDPQLARRLGQRLATVDNIVVFEGDVLQFPLPLTRYKVVANIPFNITTAIVSWMTEATNPPEEAFLILQREAAERLTGKDQRTLVSVLLHPWFELSVVHWFRRDDFVPPPRVDVVLLHFNKRGPPLVASEERQLFRDFVTYGFTAWKPSLAAAYQEVFSRRQLRAVLADPGMHLHQKPSLTTPEQWLTLYRRFADLCSERQQAIVVGAEERLRVQQQKLEKVHRTRRRS